MRHGQPYTERRSGGRHRRGGCRAPARGRRQLARVRRRRSHGGRRRGLHHLLDPPRDHHRDHHAVRLVEHDELHDGRLRRHPGHEAADRRRRPPRGRSVRDDDHRPAPPASDHDTRAPGTCHPSYIPCFAGTRRLRLPRRARRGRAELRPGQRRGHGPDEFGLDPDGDGVGCTSQPEATTTSAPVVTSTSTSTP